MSNAIEEELSEQARETGIPKKELRRLCLKAGLEQLKTNGITIRKPALAASPAPSDPQEGGEA